MLEKKTVGFITHSSLGLKDARKHVAKPLCFLFNQLLTEHLFLTNLSVPTCFLFSKKDGPEDQIHYRPNSLPGALAKIFEILLRDQILANLGRIGCLHQHSLDIEKKFQLQMLFYTAMKKSDMISIKNIVTGAFLDLSKAFGSISHPIYLHESKFLGFSEQAKPVLNLEL